MSRIRVDPYGELRLMLIRMDDPSLVDDLCAHYRRSGFSAVSVGGGMVDVRRTNASNAGLERREIVMHLRVWKIIHSTAHAQVLD